MKSGIAALPLKVGFELRALRALSKKVLVIFAESALFVSL